MPKFGVCYVALGKRAKEEQRLSSETLPEGWPVFVYDKVDENSELTVEQQAHLAKTRAIHWTPYDWTLLLDADTRVLEEPSLGFHMLKKHWDIAMVPSIPNTPGQVLWSLSTPDREYTFKQLGYWRHPMLNTGVIYFSASSAPVGILFEAWEREWLKFKDRDQGAFLRALFQNPVKLILLGKDYNSAEGKVIKHLFGRAR